MAVTSAGWAKTYAQVLRVADVCAMLGALWVAFAVSRLNVGDPLSGGAEVTALVIPYWAVAVAIVILWSLLAEVTGSRRAEVFAQGTSEFTRIFNSAALLFTVIAALSFLARAEPSRLFLGVWLVLGLLLLLVVRVLGRRFLWSMRSENRMKTTVFLVGTGASNREALGRFADGSLAGFRVVGDAEISQVGVVPGESFSLLLDRLASDEGEADVVVLTEPNLLSPQARDDLSARLELMQKGFALWANAEELATARMRLRLEPRAPLIRVRDVQLSYLAGLYKRTVDLALTTVALVALAPLFGLIAVLIRLDSEGPAFFRQTRVGQFGREFTIIKFRTMIVDAERARRELEAVPHDAGNSVLFKMKSDPRITRVGKFLRATSLDELPQLLNVFGGNMSLVGPRPPLPSEVEIYEGSAHRRLAAKPGLTGLWQISGRSDLSWDESVTLDLRYVENWSPIADVLILLKTIPAVVRGRGAY